MLYTSLNIQKIFLTRENHLMAAATLGYADWDVKIFEELIIKLKNKG